MTKASLHHSRNRTMQLHRCTQTTSTYNAMLIYICFTLKPGDMAVDIAILNLGHFMRQKKEQGAPSEEE